MLCIGPRLASLAPCGLPSFPSSLRAALVIQGKPIPTVLRLATMQCAEQKMHDRPTAIQLGMRRRLLRGVGTRVSLIRVKADIAHTIAS